MKKRRLMFYEKNCDPCMVMEPVVERVEKDLGVKIEKLEVWYNQENKQLLDSYAGFGTVPFFYNEETGDKIVGEADYETLKNWAKNK